MFVTESDSKLCSTWLVSEWARIKPWISELTEKLKGKRRRQQRATLKEKRRGERRIFRPFPKQEEGRASKVKGGKNQSGKPLPIEQEEEEDRLALGYQRLTAILQGKTRDMTTFDHKCMSRVWNDIMLGKCVGNLKHLTARSCLFFLGNPKRYEIGGLFMRQGKKRISLTDVCYRWCQLLFLERAPLHSSANNKTCVISWLLCSAYYRDAGIVLFMSLVHSWRWLLWWW